MKKYYIMVSQKQLFFIFTIILLLIGCAKNQTTTPTLLEEKKAILQTLNNETKAAFQRDYEGWTKKWVHDPTITKTYLNFQDSSFSESKGWDEISHFVKTYIEEHPEPQPLPSPIDQIEVRLYGTGAWVTYEQLDPKSGRKKETRLMEKIDGEWKIAGMQTTIYGFEKE